MTFRSPTEAFEFYYKCIMNMGTMFDGTKALFNESFTIQSPALNRITTSWRKWSVSYADREWTWYMDGTRDVSEIKKHALIWDKMHRGDNLVWSNYGYWWKHNNQLGKMIELLKDKPQTRRAFLVHFDVNRLEEYEYDTPCNLVLSFFLLNQRLYLHVFARSIDLWYGFCNDQFMFSKLMVIIASELQVGVGEMTFSITNLHLYEKQWNIN